MVPVRLSPFCFKAAVAVMAPSGPLIVSSQSPAMFDCADSDATASAAAQRVDNTFAIFRCLQRKTDDTTVRVVADLPASSHRRGLNSLSRAGTFPTSVLT